MVEKRNACRILVENSKGETLLERPRHIWKNNIKMDLKTNGV
jgi:hypothetical protein